MKKEIDLTAVITMHSEGILAHKTIRSVLEALSEVKDAGYTYEIILHIDNGDANTKKYASRYKDDANFSIYENKFGDLGLSRNFAAKKANGKYVAFLDGDDLISPNWYIEAIKALESSQKEIVVHPEAILTFGIDQPNILTMQTESYSKEKDTTILLGENRWCSVVVGKKSTFLKVPYRELNGGYSYEDYVFNAETTSLGIKHSIVTHTVLFYRRSDSSMLSISNSNSATIPYLNLFDFDNAKKIKITAPISTRQNLRAIGYKLYKKIRSNGILNYFITPIAKFTLKILNGNKASFKVPDFVLKEWLNINHIDSQLYPYPHVVKNTTPYSAENQAIIGEFYCKISQSVTTKPDYIFIVPWLIRGGADKALLNYVKALSAAKPDIHILVISTLSAKNIWAKELPSNVDYIDFGRYKTELPPAAADKLFTRLIVQTGCQNIHIINSEYGYMWARRYKELLGNRYNVTASLFAWEYIDKDEMRGIYSYDNPCLFEIYDILKGVFTDNQAIIDYSMETNGFNENKFKVHYQPLEGLEVKPVKTDLVKQDELHILWAGRIVPVKMPSLVAAIGRKLDRKITIHVYGEIGDGISPDIFSDISAIQYHGPYDNFSSLPYRDMDLFLYTSSTDGMPNTILEATAAGLPIIATNDGGVGEFIQNEKTGLLVSNWKADDFVKAIDWASNNMSEMRRYAAEAQKLLAKRHSAEHFIHDVKRDFNL